MATDPGKVQTVLGPVEPEALGITLTHEHLLVDLTFYYAPPEEASERALAGADVALNNLGAVVPRSFFNLDQQRLLDEATATDEARALRRAGGGTLVDVTSNGIGRDPLALARIARGTGLNIVMGAGYYIPESHPADMARRTEDDLYAEMVRDVTVGVGDTGIKSGILGELGCDYPASDNVAKVLRAAAAASRDTGAPISIHPGFDERSAVETLGILAQSGADLNRVAFGHLGIAHRDPATLLAIVQAGAYAQFDHFGSFEDSAVHTATLSDRVVNDTQRLEMSELLIEEGYEDRVLFSHDVCWKSHQNRYGGKGYGHVITDLSGRMRRRGFSLDQIDKILVQNPARLLTLV